jgi:phage shock protein PspC (stress-responsive transcriptional regulator)
LAFLLPREDEHPQEREILLLGVASRLAPRIGIEVAPLRALWIFLALGSFGAAFLLYLVLHFLLPRPVALIEAKERSRSDNFRWK